SPMVELGCDHIVLGCTHYPFLKSTIFSILKDKGKDDIKVIDTAEPVAKRVRSVLQDNDLTTDRLDDGTTTFISSSASQSGEQLQAIFNTINR
ncbi:MAG: hypothetical protein RSB93_03980, partial [Rikenellaceae bacterium]